MKNWYLIQTKPKQEAEAQRNLSDQNYAVFFRIIIVMTGLQFC